MRVAAISHSCVIDVNQQLYVELAKSPDVELLLIAPKRWCSSLRGQLAFSALPSLAGAAIALPARLPGHIHFHWYKDLGPRLLEFEPDVLYVDEEPYSVVTSQALMWRSRLGCKFVFYTKQNLLKRYPIPFSWMQRRVLNAADHAMVVSEGGEEVLHARGYTGAATQLPHGVDPEFYSPRDAQDLRRRLRIDRPVVGYVGRIAPEKGVWDLLEATRILVDRIGPTFTVLLIGDGPSRWKLEEAARRQLPQGVFRFTGSVAHHVVPDYLNVLDLLVLPSRTQRHWKEQFGRVLVEALACGVPVIGSDSGHIPDLIEHTGGGLVFHEGDAAEMATRIETSLSDQASAREMAERGRAVVLEEFSNPRVAAILHSALTSALES